MDAGDRSRRRGGGTLVIGVAGGVGSGKSALASAFGRLGFAVVDADRVAKEALDREDVRATVVEWFGEEVVDEHGRVDRGALARVVFGDEGARRRLERLVHPIAVARCERAIEEAARAGRVGVVIDAPLLYEVGLDSVCDAVVFVEASEAVRVARVGEERGWDAEELRRREAAQMSLGEKRRRSRFIVENNSADLSVLEGEAERIYDILRQEAESRPE